MAYAQAAVFDEVERRGLARPGAAFVAYAGHASPDCALCASAPADQLALDQAVLAANAALAAAGNGRHVWPPDFMDWAHRNAPRGVALADLWDEVEGIFGGSPPWRGETSWRDGLDPDGSDAGSAAPPPASVAVGGARAPGGRLEDVLRDGLALVVRRAVDAGYPVRGLADAIVAAALVVAASADRATPVEEKRYGRRGGS